MTQPSILPYIHRFQAVALLLIAAWLVLASSWLDVNSAGRSADETHLA